MKPEVGNNQNYADLPPVAEGMYETIVKSYKIVENPYYHPKPYTSDKAVTVSNKVYQPGDVIPADPEYKATQYQFVFEIQDGPEKGRWLFKRTGTLLTGSERNHLYKLFSKIVPVDYLDSLIADKDSPDIDDEIVGQPIICTVEVTKNKRTGKPTAKISGFMRSNREPAAEEADVFPEFEEDKIEWTGEGE